jgi:ATP-dependent Lon protease
MEDLKPNSTTDDLQKKIVDHFEGKVVRKDLTQLVKGNAVVPSYVLEYLLGQYCPTDDEDLIRRGVEKVRNIVNNHYVHRDEAELVKSKIRQRGEHKIIDRVTVSLNENRDVYLASFSNLGVSGIEVKEDTVMTHPKLLTGGVWCIVDMAYLHTEESARSPWIIEKIKPIQLAGFDLDEYVQLRSRFTLDEWVNLVMQSIGLDPSGFGWRTKLLHLVRLIPYCERNYNFIELGPKGTGKSHIFSEFSPHGILISGGDVTKAKLFVNNNTGDIGLVGYWDVVGFDEFAGKGKGSQRDLVDIMKNYMANRSFSRGRDTMSAEASLVFIGNTDRSVPYMLKHSNLFEALPDSYYDPAFIDRLHFYLPGWEIDKVRSEMFADGYGFIVDYLAEGLHTLRKEDYSLPAQEQMEFDSSMTKRDQDGTLKTLSGLLKILYPGGNCPDDVLRDLLDFAMEGRVRVKHHLRRIDDTFEPVDFRYTDTRTGEEVEVETLEHDQHRQLVRAYARRENGEEEAPASEEASGQATVTDPTESAWTPDETLKSGRHATVKENQTGVSYRRLFADHLRGAQRIEVVDPYIRKFHQARKFLEFCKMLVRILPDGEEIRLSLLTGTEEGEVEDQEAHLQQVKQGLVGTGIRFDYEITWSGIHDRSIKTDTGWKILLGRGLDIFQYRENPLSLGRVDQEARPCKPFEVTYLREADLEEPITFAVDVE